MTSVQASHVVRLRSRRCRVGKSLEGAGKAPVWTTFKQKGWGAGLDREGECFISTNHSECFFSRHELSVFVPRLLQRCRLGLPRVCSGACPLPHPLVALCPSLSLASATLQTWTARTLLSLLKRGGGQRAKKVSAAEIAKTVLFRHLFAHFRF